MLVAIMRGVYRLECVCLFTAPLTAEGKRAATDSALRFMHAQCSGFRPPPSAIELSVRGSDRSSLITDEQPTLAASATAVPPALFTTLYFFERFSRAVATPGAHLADARWSAVSPLMGCRKSKCTSLRLLTKF